MAHIILGTTGMFLLQMEFVGILVVTLVFTVPLLTLEHLPLHMGPLHVFR